ncbi:hypothetical protein MUN76_15060 [Leucobacter rhizosphaerae]|uniref:Uncharacterized protein n=1 Tax=Leucobacter rhizosphaerae TaxID=2932245 RepID=A0ABY4FVS5_9MICO|nr:hypothetical protein [Leucobacter rhizosphaerae]UOQ60331.1 hypothetical protein MUN76_15060 [Leucobacter rhizosphaerae]
MDHRTSKLRVTLKWISAAAILGIVAAAVWFVFAAQAGSGGQMVAASAAAAALGSGWSGAYAAITAKIKAPAPISLAPVDR